MDYLIFAMLSGLGVISLAAYVVFKFIAPILPGVDECLKDKRP